MRVGRWTILSAVAVLGVSISLAACGGGGGGNTSSGGRSINVAIVDNPQMKDIASLTPSLFTKTTGIKVHYTVLDEGTLRQVTTRDVAAGGRQFDVVMIGPYEAPQFGQDGTITDLTSMAKADKSYNYNDLIPTVRNALSVGGKMYAAPFYGESSFLMYRKDILKAAGITMPAHPTWAQVASIAAKINKPGMAGICLRGKPGWGDLGASLTTVLNTMGATWWSANSDGSVGKAEINQPAFKNALQFYVNLIHKAGEKDAANSSFNECLTDYMNGKVAMWYDATVGASSLEANNSPVKGKNGYVAAPVDDTKSSGWLWSWALAIPKTTSKTDLAWKYISFATGPQYLKEAGAKISGGWAAIPPGTRNSTYEIPQYKKAAEAFAGPTLTAIANAPINNPGTTKRPGLPGVQYVGIPQFQDVGNQCTQQFAAAISGTTSVSSAVNNCQNIASQVGQ
ncbi:MAG TPA: sugar ABC transporter substrate-binding protein [Thermoleophilaceae bacterium]|jgi:sorbitol/mannitol transport system substrate-binding protein